MILKFFDFQCGVSVSLGVKVAILSFIHKHISLLVLLLWWIYIDKNPYINLTFIFDSLTFNTPLLYICSYNLITSLLVPYCVAAVSLGSIYVHISHNHIILVPSCGVSISTKSNCIHVHSLCYGCHFPYKHSVLNHQTSFQFQLISYDITSCLIKNFPTRPLDIPKFNPILFERPSNNLSFIY